MFSLAAVVYGTIRNCLRNIGRAYLTQKQPLLILPNTSREDTQAFIRPLLIPSVLPRSPAQNAVGLAEVFSEAAVLLAALPCQDWTALAGCNRQLRSIVHSYVQVITVDTHKHISHCVTGRWHSLILIKVKPRAYKVAPYLQLPMSSNFQLIATLVSSPLDCSTSAVAHLVRPMVQLSGFKQSTYLAAAASHLWGLGWQRVEHLAVRLCKFKADVMAQIIHLDLSTLKELDLSGSNLGLNAIEELVKSVLPKLDKLNLAYNLIEKVAMATLILGNWQSLVELDLSHNPLLTAAAIHLIPTAANWKALASVLLNHVDLDVACAHAVAQLHTRLTLLGLCSSELKPSGMLQMFSVAWPCLQALYLRDNDLGADAIAALADASLSSLTVLDLAHNKLDAAAALQLVSGRFPCLRDLCLDHNDLNNASMTVIAKGHWPALLQLSLPGNYINARGIERLMQGNWPELRALTLDRKAISSATWGHLDLAAHAMPDPEQVPNYLAVHRSDVLPLQRVVWPKLLKVEFGYGVAKW